jgi:hypothetical protein
VLLGFSRSPHDWESGEGYLAGRSWSLFGRVVFLFEFAVVTHAVAVAVCQEFAVSTLANLGSFKVGFSCRWWLSGFCVVAVVPSFSCLVVGVCVGRFVVCLLWCVWGGAGSVRFVLGCGFLFFCDSAIG